MSYRIAIAISGAVSLGSYEAGVAYELINAIGQHNQNNHDQPDRQIHIDVLTGASAGGMTATIMAQKLLFDAEALTGPFTNDLYRAWVQEVDISGLLSTDLGDNPRQSLLSSNFVDTIAQKILLQRYQSETLPATPHPAAAPELQLALAMSNLNGVDYAVDAFKNASLETTTGRFIQTRFQDAFSRTIGKNTDNETFWSELKQAARACGAFPTAFAPLALERFFTEVDYFNKAMPFDKARFTYVDGGTFNNYPLGMAKNLADRIDVNPLDYEYRYYFYISPNSKDSTRTRFDADTANPFNTALAITSAVFNQARFQDWMLTGRYNDLVAEMDVRAYSLCAYLLNADAASIAAMDQASDVFLQRIFEQEPTRDQAREAQILAERYRHGSQAEQLLRTKGEAVFATWIKAVQVFESGGHLHDRDLMQIYTITAAPDELASDGLFAFVGFLEERFRAHDYNVGRRKARELLNQLQLIHREGRLEQENHLPLVDFTFTDPLPDLPNLGGAGIHDVGYQVRKEVSRRVRQRVNLWLKQEEANWLVRKALLWYVEDKLKKELYL
jgi:predicted acylesterase/phospholipase RssA